MGYAAAIKRAYTNHNMMFSVAVSKLIARGYTQNEAISFLKGK